MPDNEHLASMSGGHNCKQFVRLSINDLSSNKSTHLEVLHNLLFAVVQRQPDLVVDEDVGVVELGAVVLRPRVGRLALLDQTPV